MYSPGICRHYLSGSRNLFKIQQQNKSIRYASYASTLPERFYNEEQLEMQSTLKKVIDAEINPHVNKWEDELQFPSHEIFKKLGHLGLLGVNKPTENGGLGLSYKYQAAILEELGSINCGGVPSAISVHTDMATPALTLYGSNELKKEFLDPAIQGETVACVAVSEPSAGSDVAGLKTTAVRKGDDYVINGEKIWITNGMKADWTCLIANTSQGAPHKNKSLIIVPLNSKGVTRTKIRKMGLHCSDWAQLHFEDVRVPVKNLIGEEGKGFTYQMLQFQDERLACCLTIFKALDNLISETVQYTGQRKAFGKSILDNQAVSFRIGELATEVEALRALTYKAVDLKEQGQDVTLLASMAKLKAGRLAREVTDGLLQYWGGMGYSQETLVSRFYRDLRPLSIAGGADEVMLQIISKMTGMAGKK
ncbi:unnamed protein product [Allacma fusca]|uniref:Acyl-CoA dehydrogenase n=1 Tax=Allacma fusca TaxID=39272 RepID=A0A8J2P538_9HEXA|nr:unnamed protein product [Allacma fusca]